MRMMDESSPIPLIDSELFAWVQEHLYTAVLSDSCDEAGYRNQAMGPEIRPADESLVLVGRARTTLWEEIDYVLDNPYEGEMRAMDTLKPGEVPVMATNASKQIATLGELMSTACLKRGGRGMVTDGLIRDVRRIRELRIPIFSGGYKPVDSKGRGRVSRFDVPVTISRVTVEAGDLVVGDVDGVGVVPRSAERQILELAWHQVTAENNTRAELEQGALLSEVYAKYGVL